MESFGIIGTGTIGSLMARAICNKIGHENVYISNRTRKKVVELADEIGVVETDNMTLASTCRYIILCVKPQGMAALLSEIAPSLQGRGDRFILVTPAAGLSAKRIEEMCGFAAPVIRIMPNTPASVGEGLLLVTANGAVTAEEIDIFTNALSYVGKMDRINEKEMDAASIISGCGPAYVFMFMDALERAGISLGLDPEKARLYAQQTILGSAKLAMTTGDEPDALKTKVCSPGGTTIEGVRSFEENGLYQIVEEAAKASYRRALELAGK